MKPKLPNRKGSRLGSLFCTALAVAVFAFPSAAQNQFIGIVSPLASTSDSAGNAHAFYIAQNQHIIDLPTGEDLIESNEYAVGVLPNVFSSLATVNVVNSSNDTVRLDVFYMGTNNHIYQLSGLPDGSQNGNYDGYLWFWVDLTNWAGGPLVSSYPNLTAASDPGGEHVYYEGQDGHIHQYFWNNSTWLNQDLTQLSGATALGPVQLYGITSFSDSAGEHVFYMNYPNDHIYELVSSNDSTWGIEDWTNFSGSVLAWGTGLTAFSKYSNAGDGVSFLQDYVFYGGPTSNSNFTTNNVYGLADTESCIATRSLVLPRLCVFGWWNENLTAATGGPQPAIYNAMTSFESLPAQGAAQNVFYVAGNNFHVHQITMNGSTTDKDLTVSSGAASGAVNSFCWWYGSPLAGTDNESGEFVFYIGQNFHIFMLSSSNGAAWANTDLTVHSGAPVAFSQGLGECSPVQ
jgi:hypothetical protein